MVSRPPQVQYVAHPECSTIELSFYWCAPRRADAQLAMSCAALPPTRRRRRRHHRRRVSWVLQAFLLLCIGAAWATKTVHTYKARGGWGT